MSGEKQFCEYCGYELPLDSQFCENCGKPVLPIPEPPVIQQDFSAKPAPPVIKQDFSARPAPPVIKQDFNARPAPSAIKQDFSTMPAPAAQGRPKKWMAFGLVGALVAGLILCVAAGALGIYLYRSNAQEKTATEAAMLTEAVVISETALPGVTLAPALETSLTVTPTPVQQTAIVLPVNTVTPYGLLTFASHGISFDYDHNLATDFDIVMAEEQSGAAVMEWEALPQHLELIFRGYSDTESNLEARIAFYPVEDYYRVNPNIGDAHATLQQMLMMRRTENLPEPLPFFPFWDAGQVIAVKVAYLDFANGSGVRYLTQYASDVYPINNMSLFYTFQGLTDDGKYIISAILPVSNPILPDPQVIAADPAFYDAYGTYLSEVKADLTEQPDDSFTPDLAALDALFESLLVE